MFYGSTGIVCPLVDIYVYFDVFGDKKVASDFVFESFFSKIE